MTVNTVLSIFNNLNKEYGQANREIGMHGIVLGSG